MVTASMTNIEFDRHQMNLDFEEELKRAVSQDFRQENTQFVDFGLGKAQSLPSAYYLPQGIIVF